jgi:hypothetical protein
VSPQVSQIEIVQPVKAAPDLEDGSETETAIQLHNSDISCVEIKVEHDDSVQCLDKQESETEEHNQDPVDEVLVRLMEDEDLMHEIHQHLVKKFKNDQNRNQIN